MALMLVKPIESNGAQPIREDDVFPAKAKISRLKVY